ncbi:MAG: putative lipopolysaccharide heptosyltransferase III [Nitrospirae bacterium]|nr:putative lipopolysaccharide heptosyltransferase III [Nitrospirota bacterium]
MNFKNVKKILVIKFRHIGDVLLTVPVFRALRENFPQAYIAALVNSGTQEVLTGNPLIDDVIVFNRGIKKLNLIKKYLNEFSFLRTIRQKGFDMAVDLTSGDRAAIAAFISGAQYRLTYDLGENGFIGKKYLYTHFVQKDGSQHMVLQNLDVVKQFGISTENLDVKIFIPEDDRRFVKNILSENYIKKTDRIVHIHPTSRWLFKCWEDKNMAGVISWLLNIGIKVIVTSSPDKKEMAKAKKIISLVRDCPDSTARPPQADKPVNQGQSLIDLSGKTTIKQLAAISEISDVFFGVDSAPMHIAAAVGTPVIALFGPTGDAWKPWGKNHVVLSKEMDCKPCRPGVCDRFELRRCLEMITEQEVMDALASMLGLKDNLVRKSRTEIS